MTNFWTIWISVITLGSIVGCIFLLRWTTQNNTGVDEGEAMSHEFDGIIEMNNGIPKWWRIMFYATIGWAFIYLAVYGGLGAFNGLSGFESSNQDIRSLAESKKALQEDIDNGNFNQYAIELSNAEKFYSPIFKGYAAKGIDALLDDEAALQVGQRLFMQNCAQCHGSDARGNMQGGFPNLTDKDWLYGGEFDHIKTTLIQGRSGIMPAWEATMGKQGVKEVITYTLSLSGRQGLDPNLVEAGKGRFAVCAACHGTDGTGNIAMGAPNLTDNIWLYGGSEQAVMNTVLYGRNGVMPAWKEILGEDKIHVVSAYIYSLSNED